MEAHRLPTWWKGAFGSWAKAVDPSDFTKEFEQAKEKLNEEADEFNEAGEVVIASTSI